MVCWSSVLRFTEPKIKGFSKILFKNVVNNGQIRKCHNTFIIKPTSWQWQKTKDYFHFYTMCGLIPVTALIFLVNIFVGPATLESIPEGYEPKYWEYNRHPITRFIVKYMMPPPQQEYERTMFAIWREKRNMDIRQIYQRVEDLIRERDDYQYYYYIPESAKTVYLGKYDAEVNKYSVSKDYGPKEGHDY